MSEDMDGLSGHSSSSALQPSAVNPNVSYAPSSTSGEAAAYNGDRINTGEVEPESTNQGFLRRCCVSTMLMENDQPPLNIGRCVEHRHTTFFNEEIGNYARTDNGVHIILDEVAQNDLKSVYDGQPLLAVVAKPSNMNCCAGCCKCDGCKECFKQCEDCTCKKCLAIACGPCIKTCSDCKMFCDHCQDHCLHTSVDVVPIARLWYGRRDAEFTTERKWPWWLDITPLRPCVRCANKVRQPVVFIDPKHIRLLDFKLDGPGSDRATIVATQPKYTMTKTFAEKMASDMGRGVGGGIGDGAKDAAVNVAASVVPCGELIQYAQLALTILRGLASYSDLLF